jgi:hypothetical protein
VRTTHVWLPAARTETRLRAGCQMKFPAFHFFSGAKCEFFYSFFLSRCVVGYCVVCGVVASERAIFALDERKKKREKEKKKKKKKRNVDIFARCCGGAAVCDAVQINAHSAERCCEAQRRHAEASPTWRARVFTFFLSCHKKKRKKIFFSFEFSSFQLFINIEWCV